ncbi:hypothetical protein RHODGE_RHODGE_02837 [Rhodoplanes serenus]|uniref:Uncharacterized protein n=1 Tax=Rhodoplanes serenus TaxID=200615 RepID=A0A447CWU9_9BRAD|nr:hypothetical protein [Rhodoplanes serenus]MBI5111294.1 hypothetical protein [Rhodovulum sp.]VCU09668.1 hypothetical protein RHODGE_RHODGE_02837 [Rhodoplanes serenus]
MHEPAIAAYVSGLINQPWARDGRHCWRLVCDVQRDLFGRVLPAVVDVAPPPGAEGRQARARLFAEHDERRRWRPAATPVHGAVALMRRAAAPRDMLIHAGVWLDLDGGGCLHSADPHGVVLDTLPQLAARGWVPTWFVPID